MQIWWASCKVTMWWLRTGNSVTLRYFNVWHMPDGWVEEVR